MFNTRFETTTFVLKLLFKLISIQKYLTTNIKNKLNNLVKRRKIKCHDTYIFEITNCIQQRNMFHLFKRKILTLKNNREKQQQLQKKESKTMWERMVLLFFSKTIITLKLKPQMKLCSCPLESIYCLKKCPGAHSTLDKCDYRVPSTSHNFCRICQMTST